MKRIRVRYGQTSAPGYMRIWLLAGLIEELRNNGVRIPAEGEELIREALLKVNVATYVNGIWARQKSRRLVGIIESLDVPDCLPDVYDYAAPHLFSRQPRLAPFTTTCFLEDKVLGIGLKSYPYVIDVNGDGKIFIVFGVETKTRNL